MKKTISINLGGSLLIFNNNAFKLLDKYIDKVEKHFKNADDFEEILDGIETKLAELLQEKLKHKSILNISDVNHAISIMSTTKEFDLEDNVKETFQFNPGKKLFRDDTDTILGGVCSGITQYFGIHDPIWVRSGFLVIFFLGLGSPVLAYLILLAILKTPKSAQDKLAMKGKPINLNSIISYIQIEIENIFESVKNFGNKY